MKVVLLAGGLGTRISEETNLKPKPMIEIGGKPMLWHIMKLYDTYGFKDFIIACGYKSEVIKLYFANMHLFNNDCVFNTKTGNTTFINSSTIRPVNMEPPPDWIVRCVDTGLNTLTAGRIKKLKDVIGNNRFMLTYGDGISNVNIKALLEFHNNHNKIATVTAVRPKARFGTLTLDGNCVTGFSEKKQTDTGWINGGFFVFEPEIFDYLTTDEPLEQKPLYNLSKNGELMAYYHSDFWQPVDTLNEKNYLNDLWESNQAPWKIWDTSKIVDELCLT